MSLIFRNRKVWFILLSAAFLFPGAQLVAQESRSELNDLRQEIQALKKSNAQKDKTLEDLSRRVERAERNAAMSKGDREKAGQQAPDQALDQALKEIDESAAVSQSARTPASGAFYALPLGSAATLRLIDVSFDVLLAAGGSTESDQSLQSLQGGDHDPKKRGFTLGQAELSLAGAVDPYFTGEAHMVFKIDALSGDSEVELEEAFLKTQALPFGLQAKVGHYLTEFGRINPTHPHAWLWLDQPIIATRLFGSDGLRAPGMRLSWLMPLPWFTEFYVGVQNANGETAHSFLANSETSIGGHPFFDRAVNGPAELLYSTRLTSSFNVTPTVTTQVGASGLYGPNASGPHGKTFVYGGDVVVKWKPLDHFRGWPFVVFEAEAMERIYEAQTFFALHDAADPTDDVFVSGETLRDWGVFAQLLYGFYPRFAAGLRYEYTSGNNQLFFNRHGDSMRDERQRVSPLLAFYPSEFSRLRLQYNYDHAEHLWKDAHAVWAGIEFLFGTHPAHKF